MKVLKSYGPCSRTAVVRLGAVALATALIPLDHLPFVFFPVFRGFHFGIQSYSSRAWGSQVFFARGVPGPL